MIIKKPKIELDSFNDTQNLDVKYGLNKEIKYCKKCLMSNQRPNMCPEHLHTIDTQKATIKFNDDYCDACKLTDNKKDVDWDKRDFELRKLLEKYRSKDGSYDVLVPGSGGKDSFYVAHKLKYEYGMHPLTCTFAPNIPTEWGKHNFYNWINAGFANYLFNCDNLIHRFITRLSIETLLHPFQPWILGQKNFPTKFAAKLKIPLIIYGENPAEYGNPNEKYYDDMLMEWFACDDLSKISIAGIPIRKLRYDYSLKENELDPYIPLTFDQFKKADLKCVAFSYFENWHPQKNYYYTVKNSDFKPSPERTLGTYSKYASIDDKIDDLHFYTTKVKFGIGRTHYDVAQEIRSGDLTTQEGKSLINKYDGEYPDRFLTEILQYLSINKDEFPQKYKFFEEPVINQDYFDDLCDSFRSPHIWKKTNLGWVPRKSINDES